jgi:hypothetical protein
MKQMILEGVVCAAALVAAPVSAAVESTAATRLWYERPAVQWTDALPVGNGQMGAMLFGGVESERIQFNEYTLWTGKPRSYARAGAAQSLAELRRLVAAGRKNAAAALANRTFLANPALEAAYQPCGDLTVTLDGVAAHTGYRRALDLTTGLAQSSFTAAGVRVSRETFAPYDRPALLVGDAGVHGRRVQHDGGAGLTDRADGDPPHPRVADVEADLEAEDVTVEGQRRLGIVVRQEARVNADVHAVTLASTTPPVLLDS